MKNVLIFYSNFYVTMIDKLSLSIAPVRLLDKMNVKKSRNALMNVNINRDINLEKVMGRNSSRQLVQKHRVRVRVEIGNYKRKKLFKTPSQKKIQQNQNFTHISVMTAKNTIVNCMYTWWIFIVFFTR